MLKTAQRYFETIRYLKPNQVYYRIRYAATSPKVLIHHEFGGVPNYGLTLVSVPNTKKVLRIDNEGYEFEFLNQKKDFKNAVDWNYLAFGRLWNYNLQYAGFLLQDDIDVHQRKELIIDLYEWLCNARLAPEPYAASLRIINTIRFLIAHNRQLTDHDRLLNAVYSELHFLSGRPEFHISGNHLLENGFSLLLGGHFYNRKEWIKQGEDILCEELNEQILEDGAHYERSPMYHKIILFRILEALSYLNASERLYTQLKNCAEMMLAWLEKMTLENGFVAHFNDSVEGIAPATRDLKIIAENAGIHTVHKLPLGASGYRVLKNKSATLIADVEGIKPDHQPGHAHADSLSFVLAIDGKTIFVDPGVSTYQEGAQRDLERSSKFHNTVTIDDENSADVWDSFRVGRRPSCKIITDSELRVAAEIVYKTSSSKNVSHFRSFELFEKSIRLKDKINHSPAIGRFYLATGIEIKAISENQVILDGDIAIDFSNVLKISKFIYGYNIGFNKQTDSNAIEYQFDGRCEINIKWD